MSNKNGIFLHFVTGYTGEEVSGKAATDPHVFLSPIWRTLSVIVLSYFFMVLFTNIGLGQFLI